jgi:hypothetical protein
MEPYPKPNPNPNPNLNPNRLSFAKWLDHGSDDGSWEAFTSDEIAVVVLSYDLTKGAFQWVFGGLSDTYGRKSFIGYNMTQRQKTKEKGQKAKTNDKRQTQTQTRRRRQR